MHKLDRNMPCWCGSGKKYKHCHFDFDEKLDDMHRRGAVVPTHDMIKTEAQIAGIRESAKINVAVLDYVAAHIRAGISTAEIDRWVYEQTTRDGRYPRAAELRGLPQERLHVHRRSGLPRHPLRGRHSLQRRHHQRRLLRRSTRAIYSDSSRMFIIGETTPEKKKLVESHARVRQGGAGAGQAVGPIWATWGRLCTIWRRRTVTASSATWAATASAFEFHEEPWVSYVTKRGQEMVMAPGMMFTIEPMVNMGTDRHLR